MMFLIVWDGVLLSRIFCVEYDVGAVQMDVLVEECVQFIACGLANVGASSVQAEHLLELPLQLFPQLAMVGSGQ